MSTKPKVIVRRSGKHGTDTNGRTGEPTPMQQGQPSHRSIPAAETSADSGDMTVQERSVEPISDAPAKTETSPATTEKAIPGFDLEGTSRNQQYFIRAAVILSDCSVAKSPDAIFDVLARNFGDMGLLTWWLRRVGKSHLVDLVKGKDLVDAIRKIAHALHRELSGVIGRPMARW